MAFEIFPPTATLSAGESQSFEAREGGAVVTGVDWSIAPGHKGKIDPATGIYTSPPRPIFFSKNVTIVARKGSAPEDFGAAAVHLSSSHSWIVLIAAYVAVCAALLSWWGYSVWPEAVPPEPSQTQARSPGSANQDQAGGAPPTPQAKAAPAQSVPAQNAEDTQPSTTPPGESGSPDQSVSTPGEGSSTQETPGEASPASPGTDTSTAEATGQAATPGQGQDRILALLQLIMIFGAGGALVHAVRSLYGYVGNKQFESNWAPFYFARPFEGAVLALLTIFMFEDSLIEALPGTITHKNVWTVCGVAGLVGLFTDKALRKLEQIFDAVLTPPADTRGGKLTASAALAPVLAKLTPEKAVAGSEATEVQVAGDRFVSDATALVNGSPRATVFQSAKSLVFTLTKADLGQAAKLKISVQGKSAASNELEFAVDP